MAALIDSGLRGRIDGLFHTPNNRKTIESWERSSLALSFGGLVGEEHEGENRASCVRVRRLHPEGTEIRNERQLSLVSTEELEKISQGIDGIEIDPRWLGANLCVSGIQDFTLLPPSSRLQFPSGATIVVDMQNEPCRLPAEIIEREHPGKGKLFVKNAIYQRGVTAWVQRPGEVNVGDTFSVWVPKQPAYPHPIPGVD